MSWLEVPTYNVDIISFLMGVIIGVILVFALVAMVKIRE